MTLVSAQLFFFTENIIHEDKSKPLKKIQVEALPSQEHPVVEPPVDPGASSQSASSYSVMSAGVIATIVMVVMAVANSITAGCLVRRPHIIEPCCRGKRVPKPRHTSVMYNNPILQGSHESLVSLRNLLKPGADQKNTDEQNTENADTKHCDVNGQENDNYKDSSLHVVDFTDDVF